jgi:hypothetical protein
LRLASLHFQHLPSKTSRQRENPTGHILLNSVLTNNRAGGSDECDITSIVIAAVERRLHHKIQHTHMRAEGTYTLTSRGARASKQGNLVVEPCPSLGSGPLVLDGDSKLRPLAYTFGLKIKAPILPLYFSPVNFDFPQVIVQLVSLHEAISRRDALEACHRPNVF